MSPDSSRLEGLLERSRSGELTALEKRELFDRGCEDSDLFDALATDGAIEDSLRDPAFQAKFLTARPPRRHWWPLGALAASAASAAAILFFVAPHRASNPVDRASAPLPVVATQNRPPLGNPVLWTGDGSAPILLASELAPPPIAKAVFRAPASGQQRAPRISGKITSVDGGVSIDLGATDGLRRGSDVQVLRGGQPIASLRVTAVFNDRARAAAPAGIHIQAGDEVRVPARTHLDALWDMADAQAASKDYPAALRLAREASSSAPAEWKALALEHLAAIEFRSGGPDAALRTYTEAAQSPQASAEVWEAIGVLNLLQRDRDAAAAQALERAESLSANNPAARARALNNLGVLAEMRGDATRARMLYDQANALAAPGEGRDSIGKNRTRLSTR